MPFPIPFAGPPGNGYLQLEQLFYVLQFPLSSHVLQAIHGTRCNCISERLRSLNEMTIEQFRLTNKKMRCTKLLSLLIQIFVMTGGQQTFSG